MSKDEKKIKVSARILNWEKKHEKDTGKPVEFKKEFETNLTDERLCRIINEGFFQIIGMRFSRMEMDEKSGVIYVTSIDRKFTPSELKEMGWKKVRQKKEKKNV